MDLVAVTVIHETVTQTDVNKMKTDASIDYLIQFQDAIALRSGSFRQSSSFQLDSSYN